MHFTSCVFAVLFRVIPDHLDPHNECNILDDICIAPMNSPKTAQIRRKIRILTWTLMLIWLAVSFGWVFFARALSFRIGDWEWSFWMAAQGSVLVFLLITVVNAWLVNRWERDLPPPAEPPPEA